MIGSHSSLNENLGTKKSFALTRLTGAGLMGVVPQVHSDTRAICFQMALSLAVV